MKTLYRQFIVAGIVIFSFSIFAGYSIANTYYQNITKEVNDAHYVQIAEEMTKALENMRTSGLEDYLTSLGNIGYHLYVISENGYEAYFGGEFRDKNLPSEAREIVLAGETYHGMNAYEDRSFMTGFFANELTNTVGVPFTYQEQNYGLYIRPNIKMMFSEVHMILVAMLGSVILISLLAMLWMARQLTRPIAKLTQATQEITAENYNVLVDINRQDEIGQLAESFRQMVKQLQENDAARKEFISNVSHDFQSPLLNIQGYADLLKSPTLTEAERLTYTDIIEYETKRLSNLTKQLLLITSLDQATRVIKREPFALDEQLRATIQKYRWRMDELELDVSYTIPPTMMTGDASLLENVWENLLTNAMKYNKENGAIHVEVKNEADAVKVIIRDGGIGIAPANLTNIFERFYRVDESRTKEGTGLGLAIAQQIITLHGGEIQVTSALGQGTAFTVIMPKNE